jgi:uncharacterized membrane protein
VARPLIFGTLVTRRARLRGAIRRRAQAFAGNDRSWIVLVGLVAWWIVTFSQLVWRRHDRFGSFAFDMGIYDQAVWLLGRFRDFDTVRGLPVLGHHVNLNLIVLAPFSRLGAGPAFLNIFQVVSIGMGAVPVYLLGRRRFESGWPAVCFSLAFLAHPSIQSMTWELFHPDALAITPLLCAWYTWRTRRWGWTVGFVVYAMAWKEDVALFVVMLGLVWAARAQWRLRRAVRLGVPPASADPPTVERRERRNALVLAVGAAAWFMVATRVVIPAFNDVGPFYDEFFGDLGDSPTEIATTVVTEPDVVADKLDEANGLDYVRGVIGPFGYTAIAAPAVLLLGAPQTMVNLLAAQSFVYDLKYHYVALPLTATTIASVEGTAMLVALIGRRRRGWGRATLAVTCAVVLVSAVGATRAKGLSQWGDRYAQGYWPADDDPRRPVYDRALALVPDDVAVMATSRFLPHLTHRDAIYFFPNPFQERYWGVSGEAQHDPARVTWLAVDRHQFENQAADGALLKSILALPGWRVLLDDDDIVVATRDELPGGQWPARTRPTPR